MLERCFGIVHISGTSCRSDAPGDRAADDGQNVRLKPWVGLQPTGVAPGWVGQRDREHAVIARERPGPGAHGVGEPRGAGAEMPALSVGADEQDEFERCQFRHEAPTPERRAFLARREIAAFGILTWKAEAHGGNGNARFVVENGGRHVHPLAQAITGAVVERFSGGVNFCSWCLPDDENSRGGGGANNRTGFVGKRQTFRIGAADAASADFGE